MASQSSRPASRWRRAAYYGTCALLLAATVTLLYLSWAQMRAMQHTGRLREQPDAAGGTRPADTQPQTRPATQPANELSPAMLAPADGHAFNPAQFDPAADRLDHEPAHLPDPPAGRRKWRFRRDVNGAVQKVSAWTVPEPDARTLSELARFYTDAARKRDYERVSAASPEVGDTRLLTFTRQTDEGRLRVLTVRLHRRAGSVHALIALRYAMATH